MKKNFGKKIATFALCAGMMLSTMGMTALAATSGTISGSLNGNYAYITLKNKSGNSRYCVVTLRQTDKAGYAGLTTVSTNSGNISSGNTISTGGTISKSYARGVGQIYNSTTANSGVAKTIYTDVK